jgi:sulfatase maturation enzyme AslB (radical SAM superfamily)
MAWTTAKAALDFMLDHAPRPFSVEFSGGEPLLASDLLVHCVDYMESKRAKADSVSFGLVTNGTLLTCDLVDFLAARDIKLRLSFDGPISAQNHRGEGTFDRLDGLLHETRARHPEWFQNRFRVHSVLHSETLGVWADTTRYFLAESVPEILFYPAIGRSEDCSADRLAVLEEQVQEIVDISARHWEMTDSVPVLHLRPTARDDSDPMDDGALCGAAEGAGLCVDTNGTAWSCPLFTGSSAAASPLRDEAAFVMKLGSVRSPDLPQRIAALPEKSAPLRLMTHRQDKYTSLGRCAECKFLPECFLCPAAISHQPGNEDPDRIPDFFCAYMKAAIRARQAFQEQTGGRALKRQAVRINKALRDLRLALERGMQ